MKLLAFVDTHGSERALAEIKRKAEKYKVDAVICAGDFTIFQRKIRKLLGMMNSIGKPVLIIHGNHEGGPLLADLADEYKNIIGLHRRACRFRDIFFFGCGGGGFSIRDERFKKSAEKMVHGMKKGDKCVLVIHGPPYGNKTDQIGSEHCGNRDYRSFIKKHTAKIRLVVCGHLHECFGKKDYIGRTLIVNPGPHGVVIEI